MRRWKEIAMRMTRIAAAVVLASARWAVADPAQFTSVVDSSPPAPVEDGAITGFTVVRPGSGNAHAVGAVGRAYSASRAPGNIMWGMVAEALNFPGAQGHIVGIESGVVNMSTDNVGELRGLDVVFKDRMDTDFANPVPMVGQNRFNAHSSAIYVSSQPRSPAGEYSGWQAGIRFSRHSLDRSVDVPYAAAIDVSEAEVPATFYLIVWRCGKVKCGLKPTDSGATVVVDVDNAP
jgi:hypothetical protein